MRIELLSALAAMMLSACGEAERNDQGQHADAIEQPSAATAPVDGDSARNLPGGGSGTAASEEQRSGQGTGTPAERRHESPPNR
ncbi:TPA: hypothetical protein ACKP7S_000450 [Stenotrophomonas maltophilia]